MKSLNDWFSAYAVSHQNETNQTIHYLCVPAIFFAIMGLIMCIPPLVIGDFVLPWVFLVLVGILFFYARLSISMAFKILLFAAACYIINTYIARVTNLFWVSLVIFIMAWIGQFYGHKVEGKKPSFLQDLQFLLIGPAWVIHKLFGKGKV